MHLKHDPFSISDCEFRLKEKKESSRGGGGKKDLGTDGQVEHNIAVQTKGFSCQTPFPGSVGKKP